jgi:hypothetical protein
MRTEHRQVDVTATHKLIVAAVLTLLVGRLLLIPGEKQRRDVEVRAAYDEYCACLRIDIFCAPAYPCPYPNCMGNFVRRSAEINRRHPLLSVLKPRHLLSGWQPYRGSLR